ncbi:MAG: (deoxy)nucleoside triphosphate pyrophosphohydrolase [Deltaproteobacteria bacterium]|jgi:8-oxo-dGTP diphosphatase|nr:(deoxy)nucleoside triphosphate pyrophosphohydrolase [Deltaproteobacteria bacterium]
MLPLLVTAAVIIEEDKVLLTRRLDHCRHAGFWEFPGGKLLPEESPEMALKREISEELAIVVDVNQIFETAYYRYDWGSVLVLAYECRIVDGFIQNIGVAEHRWVALTELTTYQILPADTSIVERLVSLAS